MRRLGAAIAAAAFLLPTGAARADHVSATGPGCTLVAANDPTEQLGGPQVENGVLWGGPLLVAALPQIDGTHVEWDPAGNPMSVQVDCAVQVNAPRHSDADVVATTGAPSTTLAEVGPHQVAYQVDRWDDIYVCTRVWIGDSHGWLPYYVDGETGRLTTDPNALCLLSTTTEVPAQTIEDLVCPLVPAVPPPGRGVLEALFCEGYRHRFRWAVTVVDDRTF